MIRIQGLDMAFWGVKALDGLSAALDAPVCGLIGPNGAGKTTLINVLSGLLRPGAGHIELDGTPLLPLSPVARVRLGLRRAFQTEQVVEDLSVWDNVLALLDHVPHERDRAGQLVTEALDFADLSACATRPGATLNLFERRRVELAKAVVGRPRCVLFDEPAAGLTDHESAFLRTRLRAIPGHCGAQVLLIDHDVDLIAATCIQTLVLDFGRRIALGPTHEVLQDPIVRRAYLGR